MDTETRCNVTWMRRLTSGDASEYDAFVLRSPAGHPEQTRAWPDIAQAAAHVTARFALVWEAGRVIGTALVLRPGFARLTLPWAWIDRGPVVERVEDLGRVTEALTGAARRRGVAHLSVMPYWAGQDAARAQDQLRAIGFRDVQKLDGSHACTLRIPVGGKTDVEIFAGKAKDQVRRRIKQAERAGARARLVPPGGHADWTALRALYAAMMGAQGKRAPSGRWWAAVERLALDPSRAAMHVCDFEGRVIGGCVVLRHGPLATYAWGASVPEKIPFSKATPPLVASILWARDHGCATFDFGGIPLEDDTDPKRTAIAEYKLDFDKKRVALAREHARWLVGGRRDVR